MARLLVAPDAFKGTLTAREVAAALAAGIRGAGAEADECPVADGGEGFVDVLLAPLGGEPREASCHDPLGRPLEATWGWVAASRTALVESAAASGLALLAPDELDAERAASDGAGELLLAARDAGAREALLAVGGTATTDGGAGALAAIERGGGLGGMKVTVVCDVTTPYELAAAIFGPQKGASPEAVQRLSARLERLAASLPRDPRGRAMTGAGGGLAGGIWAAHGAELRAGAPFVLDALGFDRRLHEADAVVVGEGRLDAQTEHGKAAGEILRRAREAGRPVHAVAGSVDEERVWPELATVQLAGDAPSLRAAGARLAAAG